MVKIEELLQTKTLEEAVALVFHETPQGRACILAQEAMQGRVAEEYDALGKSARRETYRRIAEDFIIRTDYKSGAIIEVGCGSGLLAIEIAEPANYARVVGVDISEDMIRLAHLNLAKRHVVHIRDKVQFKAGSVYDLLKMGFQNVPYIICRNALHRFQHPERALHEMYVALSPRGKIYIRDLRRDADWKIILERIGEQRWKSKTLVKDYISAMAGMLTTQELGEMLCTLQITTFEIADGCYLREIGSRENLQEYEKETEYVCIIRKLSCYTEGHK